MSSDSSNEETYYVAAPTDPKPFGGLQSESQSPSRCQMVAMYAYLCVAITFVVLGAVSADLRFWIRYCGARISLIELTDGSYNTSLMNAIDDCDSNESDKCGDYCSNLRDLRSGGEVMRGFGIAALALCAISVGLMLKPILWKRGLLFKLTQVLAFVFWLVGIATYGGHYEHVNSNASSETSMGPGLEIAIANMVLVAICIPLGFIAYSRLK